MKTHKLRSVVTTAAFSFLAIHVTGCMVSPLDGDKKFQTSPFDFIGGTLSPNETVEIQARHPQKGWTRIDETRSDGKPYHTEIYGESYYLFSKSVVVPSQFWTATNDFSVMQAEVRCVIIAPDGSTKSVYGFNQKFWDSFYDPDSDLLDVLDLSLNGTSVTIYSPTPAAP